MTLSPTACANESGTVEPPFAISCFEKRRNRARTFFFTYEHGVFSASEAESFVFSTYLDNYFHASGFEQRKIGRELIEKIRKMPKPENQIQAILQKVKISGSQDTIAAAIDLLIPLKGKVEQLAINVSRAAELENENAAYVLGVAVARQGNQFVKEFLKSKHTVFRESAIEALAFEETPGSRSLLKKVAEQDPSPALRDRAKNLIEDLE